MDRASKALLSKRHRRRRSVSWPSALFVVACGVFVPLALSIVACPLLQRWRERPPQVSEAPRLQEHERLVIEEAVGFARLWKHREGFLQAVGQPLDWKPADYHKARQLFEEARPYFETVFSTAESLSAGASNPGASFPGLEAALDLLFEKLALTFCTEFKLRCIRGVFPVPRLLNGQDTPAENPGVFSLFRPPGYPATSDVAGGMAATKQ